MTLVAAVLVVGLLVGARALGRKRGVRVLMPKILSTMLSSGFFPSTERGARARHVKIFRVIDGSLLGLVDGQLGSHRTSPSKPVRLVVMVKDIDAWFTKVKTGGVKTYEDAPFTGKKMKLKGFTFEDPEGYTVEMCQYLSPYGL